MKRIIIAAMLSAALLFSGCSMPQTGKGNKADSSAESSVTEIGIKGSDGQTVPISETVIYDRCSVKVTSPGMYGKFPMLTVENGSDKNIKLASSYVSADGVLRSDINISTDVIPAGGKTNISVEGLSGVCSMRTRFFLTDEDYKTLDNSLSDPIEFTLSGKLSLPAKQLYSVLYEDERVLLGLYGVTYREDSNRVTLNLYGKNKTDSDFVLSASNAECDPEDYYALMNALLPAGASGQITMRASTRNATLSAADLDSITLALGFTALEDYYNFSELGKTEYSDTFTIHLPKSGRPEVVIPDKIESTMTPEEYIAETTSSDDITPITLIGDSDLLYEDDNVLAELVLAATDYGSSGTEYCSLHFRVQNKLQKQIVLQPYGVLNGATVEFFGSSGIKPMTEQYMEVTCAIDDKEIFGALSDVILRFDYGYDDGAFDDSSYLGTTDTFVIQCAEELSRPGVPKDAKQIYSDDNCDLYLLSTEKNDTYNSIDLNVYAVNKSNKIIRVYADSEVSGLTIYKSLALLRGTYTVGMLRVNTFDESAELTADTVKDMKILVTVSDSEGNTLSSGEGKL